MGHRRKKQCSGHLRLIIRHTVTHFQRIRIGQILFTIQNYTEDKFVPDDSKGGLGSRNKSGSIKVYFCYRVIEVIEVTNDCMYESLYEFFCRLHS